MIAGLVRVFTCGISCCESRCIWHGKLPESRINEGLGQFFSDFGTKWERKNVADFKKIMDNIGKSKGLTAKQL